MSETISNRYNPIDVSAPGETLREALEERGMTQSELAVRINRPEKTLSEIIHGKAAITPETAVQLELALGISARFWLARESRYREYLVRLAQRHDLERQSKWAAKFPVRKMIKYGWIEESEDKPGEVRELLAFFGVGSATGWQDLTSATEARYRMSAAFKSDSGALSAWLQQGERQALPIKVEPYSRDNFLRCLYDIRSLTREGDPSVFVPTLQESCSRAGVAVVFVPELPGTHVSGATRWLAPSKALIQLSLRYKTNDHLWFTFFHEAAHILLHRKKEIFLEGVRGDSAEEEEADRFAADLLVPRKPYDAFVRTGVRTKQQVRDFAANIGVADGIVVGRLQHDEVIPHRYFNDLKIRYTWSTEY